MGPTPLVGGGEALSPVPAGMADSTSADAMKTILLVDDDPLILRLEQAALAQSGYRVETVEDGRAALERLTDRTYDAVVLDIMLPEMDGYEIARRVRELPANRNTPIVMVTATTDREAMQRGFTAGAMVFLTKPFTIAAFRSVVQSLVG